jgi:hypothetical protein
MRSALTGFIMFLALCGFCCFGFGCAMTHIEGVGDVGWRTENYTLWHNVPLKEHPTTAVEWQAKANDDCREILMKWRLPDSNPGWKKPKAMTGCLYSYITHDCLCTGPKPASPAEAGMLSGPTEIRFNALDHTAMARF